MGRWWVIALVAAGVVLVGAAARAQTDQVALRAYTFRFGNPATNEPTRVTVAVACRKSRPPGSVLLLKPVKTRMVVRPRTQKSGTLACPPHTTPAGAAIDLEPGRAKSVDSFAGTAFSVRSITATLRAFQFRIANAGARAHDVAVNGVFVTVLLAPEVERAKLSTTISTYTQVIAPGRHRVLHRCSSGWISLGAGYGLTPGPARVDGAAALATSGAWWVRNTAASPVTARLQVICARVA